MDDTPNSVTDAARLGLLGLLRLHEAVRRREPGRAEAALSPEALLARFREADPTLNGSCLPWLLRTYASGGYRLEDLTKARETLEVFAQFRQCLPDSATIDTEIRNPRKLGSHTTLASLWIAVAPFVEAERMADKAKAEERGDSEKENALAQSRVLCRNERMVVVAPMTKEASCWWGMGTRWCTAAREHNAFDDYYSEAPLIVICLRKSGELPACKLQIYIGSDDVQFMDENDENISSDLIEERWDDLKPILQWAVGVNGKSLKFIPEHLRTKEICLTAVSSSGMALRFVPVYLCTEEIYLAAVVQSGWALELVPVSLRTEAICIGAVGSRGWVLQDVPAHLRTEAICKDAVAQDGSALEFVPEYLRTYIICKAAVKRSGCALLHVPECLRTKEIYTDAVAQDGCMLQNIPVHMRTKSLCLTAVKSNGTALEYVPVYLRSKNLCIIAAKNYGYSVLFMPKHIRVEEVYLDIVKSNGLALYYIPEKFRTSSLCQAAIMQNSEAVRFMPKHISTLETFQALITKINQKIETLETLEITKPLTPISHGQVLQDLENYIKNAQINPQQADTVITHASYS